ncbi:molybdopterin-dependent oxidoreductase [Paenirhodobacter sp.]|uniref:molybdopterin-dependent oxidoreductase n=1 Tax=Paenirhodobacter sp. TaxID=1965326 RepID=UPI003B3C21C6
MDGSAIKQADGVAAERSGGGEVTRVRSVCPYCGVGCGIVMDVRDGKVVRLSGDKAHPANFGRLCTKGMTAHQAIDAPGRMAGAWRRNREDGSRRALPLDMAIVETAGQFRRILDTHGPDAVALYVSGQMSIEAQYLANKLAKGYLRTRHIESNSRLCMASAGSGYKLSLGADAPPGSYQDFEATDLFFVIGANMADCHPILFLRMMDRVKAGAKLIVVDPRRSATAEKAHLFLQIRPGTDLALLNGLLHLLHRDGHVDAGFIAAHTEGWEAMPAFLADYGPEKVAAITGLPQADIEAAARMIGEAGKWMSLWTMGLNQSTHGTWNTNALCNLHLATGAICRPGSGPFSLTGQPNAMGGREMGYMGPGLPGQRSALSPADRAFAEGIWGLPSGTIRAEAGPGTIAMFEAMSLGEIRACWIICTNPAASVANRDRVLAGLKAAELVIVQDAYLETETSLHADILLPGALWAEAEGVMINSERNMTLTARAVDPPGEALADWEIIARVARAMGFEGFGHASAAEVFAELSRFGNPATGYDISGASHAALRERPLQWPLAPGGDPRNPIRYLTADGPRFATESGRAVFHPRPHADPAEMPDPEFPLILTTGRVQHQWHTMTKTGRIATLNRLNPGPFVEINAEDAAELGIREGAPVLLRSRRGEVRLPARISDRMQPGTCFAPFHWNDLFGEGLAVNAATSDAVDPVSLQPEFKFCAVSLAPASGMQDARADDSRSPPMSAIRNLAETLGLEPAPALVLEAGERSYLQGFVAGLQADPALMRGESAQPVPVLPPGAPIAPERRLLLDGLLAGLFSRAQPAPVAAPAGPSVLILWASQTGNAEARAAECAERLKARGQAVRLLPMDGFRAGDLAAEKQVLIFASTFGDGEAPDNGTAFGAAILAPEMTRLDGLSYAVAAFGDPSYDSFCGFGRRIDARLAELGARPLAPRVDCDPDAEESLAAWCEGVAAALTPTASAPAAPVPSTVFASMSAPVPAPMPQAKGSRRNPLPARLVGNLLLSGPGSGKETRRFSIEGCADAIPYEAGDALGLWPRNCPALVDEIIALLGFDPRAEVEGGPLAEALSARHEIARPSPAFLAWWVERSGSEELAARLACPGEALESWLHGRQIADILRLAPAAVMAQDFIAHLGRLQPRLYSISSSPLLAGGRVDLTVSVIRHALHGPARKGVASTFLADRAEGAEFPVFIQKSADFRPPGNPDLPLVMIGPGTGIAPFRAFLQDRQATGARGRNWLFFGERSAAQDFYYREEIECWQRDGLLTRLDTAFSRDGARKVYVQDRMWENGAELWRWIADGAHIRICGDARRMARDVDHTLGRILHEHGGMAEEEATTHLREMARQKRYVRDVY